MRILHVVHQYLPEYVGGTEVYVAGLAGRLQQRGHRCAVFGGASAPARYEWEGLPVRTVAGGLRGPQGAAWTFLSTFGSREAEAALRETLDEFAPDLVHFHHLAGLPARLVGQVQRPSVFTLHDYWFMCPKSQLIDHRGEPCAGPRAGVNCARCGADRLGRPGWEPLAPVAAPVFVLRERRVRRAVGSAGLLLAPSAFLLRMALGHGLPPEKLRLVRFGVDGQVGPGTPSPRPDGPLRVTYLGGIDPSKGIHVLIAAAGVAVGELRVRVFGDFSAHPAYAATLEGMAQGTPVELAGPVPHAEVPRVLGETDLLVVPSVWYENAPMVIAEAHAAGVPVAASDLGALPEFVKDGETGFLFPPGDAVALARVLALAAREPDLLARMRASIAGGERRTGEQHLEEMEGIYEEVLAGR